MKNIILASMIISTAAEGGTHPTDDALVARTKATAVSIKRERAIIWAPSSWTEAQRSAAASQLDQSVRDVERLLSRKDARMIQFFLVDEETPSHVYGGYEHTTDDEAIVFIAGLETGEAPYLHETTHIVAGEFGSLLLREGLATHVQFSIDPGPMRPLVKLGEITDRKSLDRALTAEFSKEERLSLANEWIANPAKKLKFSSRPDRSFFYAVAASFTSFVIDRIGLAEFMRLYAEPDPRSAKFGDTTWQSLHEQWLRSVQQRK